MHVLMQLSGSGKLWLNLGRSTAGIRPTTKTSSTSTTCWPLSATASSSSNTCSDRNPSHHLTTQHHSVQHRLVLNVESPRRACSSSSRPALQECSLGLPPTLWQLWTGRWGGRVVWWWISCCWSFSPSSPACWPDPGWSREIPSRNCAASWRVTWTCTVECGRPAGRWPKIARQTFALRRSQCINILLSCNANLLDFMR